MPFLLLFLLTLAFIQGKWPEAPSWLSPLGSALITAGGFIALWLAATWMTRRFRQNLLQDPSRRSHWMDRFAKWRRRHSFMLLGFYLFALFNLGWGDTIKSSWLSDFAPGLEMILLAPMVMGLVASWSCFYDMERTAHEVALYPESSPFLSRSAYIALQARHNLLLVVPPLMLIVIHQVLFGIFPQLKELKAALPFFGAALLLIAFLSIPYLLRLFLGLKPLPAGEIRDRLEATARRLGFRYSDILVWNTRNTVANAMVTGAVPWVRYIVVTDRLLETMDVEEIEGVFGHEVGHIAHHHMFFYIAFMFTSMVVLGGLGYLGYSWLSTPSVQEYVLENMPFLYQMLANLRFYAVLPLLLALAIYMFVVFGYLSRRCERQADLYGCRTASTESFINALEKVAFVNGIPREKPGWLSSWQHGTIAQRVDFLRQASDNPAAAPTFQRRLAFLKWGVLAGLACLSALVLLSMRAVLGADEMWKFLQHL